MKESHIYEPGSLAGTARMMKGVLDGVAGAELAGSEFTRAGMQRSPPFLSAIRAGSTRVEMDRFLETQQKTNCLGSEIEPFCILQSAAIT